jgi:replicative DNA helicase
VRQPDTHLEADILAATLHDPARCVRVLLRLLEADDFSAPSTRAVFIAIGNIAKVYGPEGVTYSTVQDELRRTGSDQRDMLGLLDPNLGLGAVGSFEPKCRRLRELRQEWMVTSGMAGLMERQWENPQELMDAVAQLREDAIALSPKVAKSTEDVADDLIATLEYNLQHSDLRIKTGLPTLDKYLLGGMAPGWLAVVGARTSVGKTMFAAQIAARAALAGQKVMFFSVEEMPTEVLERVIRYLRRIPRGVGAQTGVDQVIAAALEEDIRQLPLRMIGESGLDIIVNEIGEQVLEGTGAGFVVVDYAGLVSAPGHWDSKVQEIGEVTKQLKLAALRFQVPIMLLAQVNRSPMSRKDTRPQLSDLRDSGSLEQDADVVMFLHHDEVNMAEDSLRLAKHRYGPKGEMAVRFDYPIGRLEELSHLGGEHG